MEHVRTLVLGAGITGLSTAAELEARGDKDYLVLEADAEVGGYCKTVKKEGFVWDYSGHFFHFKRPEIEAWLKARMPGQRVLTVQKKSFIDYGGHRIDFPFQKNIHQLPKEEFIDCLYDLYFRAQEPKDESFESMLHARLGRSIAEKFLIPYNEKLYACALSTLDKDAMGRFFPHATVDEILRNMRQPENATYNATFTYPEGGAFEYVRAILSAVRDGGVALSEAALAIDLAAKTVRTEKRTLRFDRLVSSIPFPRLLELANVVHDASLFSWNKVLVFNFGFDRKGDRDAHWIYYPDRSLAFYRVGYYDNIFGADRMSLYVELGFAKDAPVDVETTRARVLSDLRRVGVVSQHNLVAEHSVVMDPAYVHVTRASQKEHARLCQELMTRDVHAAGRYGAWTYCSIEDNMIEAKELVQRL